MGEAVQRPRRDASVQLSGLSIDALRERDVVALVGAAMSRGQGGWICTPNSDVLRLATHDEELRNLLSSADVVVADGMPLIWASHIAGRPLPGRIAGSDLIWSLAQAAAERGARMFLLGGNPGVAERAGLVLQARLPGLAVCGYHCPPFGFEQEDSAFDDIVTALDGSGPDMVCCCLGTPKQEWLIARLLPRYPNTWFLALGASLNFVAGDKRRAPVWMQRVGLEWTHRLAQEPRRLTRRYLVADVPFVCRLLLASTRDRFRPRASE